MNAGVLLKTAAYCLCPPALVAGSVAAVPPVRHAIHRLSAPSAPHHGLARRTADPTAAAARDLRPCLTAAALDLVPVSPETSNFVQALGDQGAFAPQSAGVAPIAPIAPLIPQTNFAPAALLPQALNPGAITAPSEGGLLPGGSSSFDTTPPNGQTTTAADDLGTGGISTAPEPSVWMMMIAGFGAVGGVLRFQRARTRRKPGLAALGAAAGSGATMPIAGFEMLQATPALASAAAQTAKAGLLAKAALCVCPMAMMATTAMVAPPVRHALYAATAPAHQRRFTAAYDATEPCAAPAPAAAD